MSNEFFKSIVKTIAEQEINCVGHRYKKEIAQKVLKLKPIGKLETTFYDLFVKKFFTNDRMLRPQDLGVTKLARLDGIFGTKKSKNEVIRVGKMLKFIQKDMSRFLFRYDFYNEYSQVEQLVEDLLNRYKKLQDKKVIKKDLTK